MKFGTLYAYWAKNGEWGGDYCALCHKAKKAGLDVLEVGAGDLLNMSDAELQELRTTAKELGLEISANLGPPKDKDVSSKDDNVRAAGVKFLCDIMDQMVKLDCKILIGALYNCWPYDFIDIDKDGLWERAVDSMKKVGDYADKLGVKIALEILNRFETCLLTDEEKVKMCGIVSASGADYIKTSTGFSTGGATFDDIALFAANVSEGTKIKAAGGISGIEDAEKFISLGADRLGTSRIVKAVKAMEEK